MTRTLLWLLFPVYAFSQPQPLTMETAVQWALQHNKELKSVAASVHYYHNLKKTSLELPKTEVSLQYGQLNSYMSNDNNYSISQTIPFPSVFGAKKQLYETQEKKAAWLRASTKNDLIYQVKQVYVQLLYLREMKALLIYQDSLFINLMKAAELRYKTGESRLLEKTAVLGRLNEVRNLLRQNEADYKIYVAKLQSLLCTTVPINIVETTIPETTMQIRNDSVLITDNPQLQYLKQEIVLSAQQKELIKMSMLPDITVGYFNQSRLGTPLKAGSTLLATNNNRFHGFQVGLSLPVWVRPLKARVRAEEQQQQVASLHYDNSVIQLQSQYDQAVQQFMKHRNSIEFYQITALPNATLLWQQSTQSYNSGDIGYIEYFLNLEQVLAVRRGYLQARNNLKQAALYLSYLEGYQL